VLVDADAAPEFMSAQECALYLGVAERTVRRWIARGDLPAEKRGRSFVIRLADAVSLKPATAAARNVREIAYARLAASARERELIELRGRYLELKERAERLERELDLAKARAHKLELASVHRAA
jgi:excisionase family DNA binding protein